MEHENSQKRLTDQEGLAMMRYAIVRYAIIRRVQPSQGRDQLSCMGRKTGDSSASTDSRPKTVIAPRSCILS